MQNEKSKSLHFTEEMDRLSTLLNRHAGEVCLEKELKKAILRNQLLCVALIDINDITDINTKYGLSLIHIFLVAFQRFKKAIT